MAVPSPPSPPLLARPLVAPAPGWTARADVVVVGSGIAGLTAALQLRRRVERVLLVTKTVLDSGSTRWAQGGIAAALTREGGHHRDRIAHAGGDATGAEISRALIAALEAVRDDPGIEVLEQAVVLDVLTTDGPERRRACGVTLHVIGRGSRDGVGAARGRAVVLATGGIGQVFRSTTHPREATEDGVAAALRAGAALADLEFVQFHPTVLWLGHGARGQQPLISEAVRGEGALLLDVEGRRFMPDVHPMAELAPRDVVAKAVVRRMAATGADNVFLDCRHLGRDFLRRRFPTIVASLAGHGIDPAEEPVPVAPAQHYHSGGVLVDRRGRSTLEGLYAVGETSCTGVHGANRLANNSLLEGLVFAHRIADDLVERLAGGELPSADPVDVPGRVTLLPATARPVIQKAASEGPGVIRTAAGLATAARRLATLPDDAHRREDLSGEPGTAKWETTNLHQVATALTHVAALRTESRGGHYREDFDEQEESWRGRLVSRLDGDGTLVTEFVPIERSDAGMRDERSEGAR